MTGHLLPLYDKLRAFNKTDNYEINDHGATYKEKKTNSYKQMPNAPARHLSAAIAPRS